MSLTPIMAGLMAFISTLSGGLIALKFRRHLRKILGFTAGVVLGVVAFDVLPELFNLVNAEGANETAAMIALVVGFLGFHLAEKLVTPHHSHDEEKTQHASPQTGLIAAAGLIGHSFLDGVGIGLAFQVNEATGLLITLAVVAHDFSDGLNTVSLLLAHGNKIKTTILMLLAGAAAPVLGALLATFFTLSAGQLAIFLGVFSGFLLYIAAGSILPEAHRDKFSLTTFALTILGVTLMFGVSRVLQ